MSAQKEDAGSQTLARGLTALEVIGAADVPISVTQLCQELGIHRSMAYRLVKTLEQFGFVERDATGGLSLGAKLSTLARGVAKSLQEAAAPELSALASELEMTAFLATQDGGDVVTLSSAEPPNAETTIAKRPGSRHSMNKGAPGKVVRSQVNPGDFPPNAFELSQDEVIPGVASIAVPLHVPGHKPAALAVIYLPRAVDTANIVTQLQAAAQRIKASC